MKKKKHTPEQIVGKLRKVERLRAEGATVAEATRQIEVSEQTYYRWRRKYAKMDKPQLRKMDKPQLRKMDKPQLRKMDKPQLRRLKELEKENARLKKLVADQALDNAILKEVLEGNY